MIVGESSEFNLIERALMLTPNKNFNWGVYNFGFSEECNLPYWVIKGIVPEDIVVPREFKSFYNKLHYNGFIFALVENNGKIYTSLSKFSYRYNLKLCRNKNKNGRKKRKQYKLICNFILTGETVEDVFKVMYYIYKILFENMKHGLK